MSVLIPFLHVVCGGTAWFIGPMILGDILFHRENIKKKDYWVYLFWIGICLITVITTDSIGRGLFDLLLFPLLLITGSL